MKRSTLFMFVIATATLTIVGSFSYGAPINHDVGIMADHGGSMDAYAFIYPTVATLEAFIDITPVYSYAGEVKIYAVRFSAKRTSLSRLARDGLS